MRNRWNGFEKTSLPWQEYNRPTVEDHEDFGFTELVEVIICGYESQLSSEIKRKKIRVCFSGRRSFIVGSSEENDPILA